MATKISPGKKYTHRSSAWFYVHRDFQSLILRARFFQIKFKHLAGIVKKYFFKSRKPIIS